MRTSVIGLFAGVVLATTCIPVYAQDLLGGLLGSEGLGSVVNVTSGPATDGGLVNVGLGGGGGNVLDLGVGNSSTGSIASASVSNNNGGLGVDANVLNDTATANLNVGGNNGNLLGANVGLLDNTANLNVNLGLGGNGVPGAPGAPGAPGRNGTNGTNGVAANGVNGANGLNGGGSRSGAVASNCDGMPANQVNRLLSSTRFDSSWSRASGVKVQPIGVCGDVKAWLNAQLGSSNLGASLRQAVQSDALISASLGRTQYGPDRVLAVKQSGSQLIVYVY